MVNQATDSIKCHDTHNATRFRRDIATTNPATHSTFLQQISLKLSDFCNTRDNKADIKNNTQHFDILGTSTKPTQNKTKCIQAKITKPTQNQVYSSQYQHHFPEKKKSRYQKQYPSCIYIGKITINTHLKFITNNLTL